MQEKLDNHSGLHSSIRKRSKSSISKAIFPPSFNEDESSEILRTHTLLAHDSVEDDKELYQQSKHNPAVLYYIIQKLSQIIRKVNFSSIKCIYFLGKN